MAAGCLLLLGRLPQGLEAIDAFGAFGAVDAFGALSCRVQVRFYLLAARLLAARVGYIGDSYSLLMYVSLLLYMCSMRSACIFSTTDLIREIK